MQNNSKQNSPQISLSGYLKPILLLILLVGGLIYGLRYWHSKSVPDYIYYGSSFNFFAMNLTKVDFAFTDKGPVLWIYSYHRGFDKRSRYYTYQIDIINPQKQTLIKRVFLNQDNQSTSTSEIFDFKLINNQFFAFNKTLRIQWRNPYNSEIMGDEKSLIQKFQQLQAGVGEMKDNNNNWYEITTKDGLKFLYSPEYNRLVTNEEKEAIRRNYYDKDLNLNDKNIRLQYAWALDGDLRKQLYLVKKHELITETMYPQSLSNFAEQIKRKAEERQRKEDYRKQEALHKKGYPDLLAERIAEFEKRQAQQNQEREARYRKDQQLVMHLKDKIFLEGEIVYQDSILCVVLHQSEIGEKARCNLTCVESNGKVRWESKESAIKILNPEKVKLTAHSIIARRQDEQLALVSNLSQNIGVAMLNLTNGQIMWEYLPIE